MVIYAPAAAKQAEKVPAKPMEGEGKIGLTAPATVVIRAPEGVTVTVNGRKVAVKSPGQTFVTPTLAPGRTFTYLVEGSAKQGDKTVTSTRRVSVRAGSSAVADFGDLVPAGRVARVTVVLPKGRTLTVNGQAMPVAGTRQTFETPTLVKGKKYTYVMKASDGAGDTILRKVRVEAGKAVTVDFTKASTLTARK